MAVVAHRFSGLRPRLLMLGLLPAIFAGLLAATGAFWAVKNDHEAQMRNAWQAIQQALRNGLI